VKIFFKYRENYFHYLDFSTKIPPCQHFPWKIFKNQLKMHLFIYNHKFFQSLGYSHNFEKNFHFFHFLVKILP